jgi:DNA-binding NarL/FixJ family response regulator
MREFNTGVRRDSHPVRMKRIHETETAPRRSARVWGTTSRISVRTRMRAPAACSKHCAMIHVAFGGGSYLLRQGIARVLATVPQIELVATCETAAELDGALEAKAIDVVITEIRRDADGSDVGIAIAEGLRETHPDVGVVILGHVIDAAVVMRVFRTGSAARAYLPRTRIGCSDDLERVIRAVADGGSVIDPKVVEALVSEQVHDRGELERLTPRERDVLALVAAGMSNAGIARRLVLSKRSVEQLVRTIYAKLDLPDESVVSRRVKAALVYTAEWPGAPVPAR